MRKIVGGTLTLLTNLAKHLSQKHDVAFAVKNASEKSFIDATAKFDHEFVLISDLKSKNAPMAIDLLICHFPYSVEHFTSMDNVRKVSVIMEIPEHFPIPINTNNQEMFDKVIYLNDTQIAGIPKATDNARFHKLNVIDDIDFTPTYRKTGDVGCVKSEFSTVHRAIEHSSGIKCFKVYHKFGEFYGPVFDLFFSIEQGGLRPQVAKQIRRLSQKMLITFASTMNSRSLKKTLQLLSVCHRIRIMGFERNIQKLFDSFDCLLRAPGHSIGVSLVVLDALACGKQVVLSDIPEHRKAFSLFKGVSFVNDLQYCLNDLVRSYDARTSWDIRDSYLSLYDRNKVLSEWEEILTT